MCSSLFLWYCKTGVLIKCRGAAKKPATLRSELSTFGGKWVKLRHEGLKLLIALNCQATYFYILAQSTLKLKYENPAVKLFLSCKFRALKTQYHYHYMYIENLLMPYCCECCWTVQVPKTSDSSVVYYISCCSQASQGKTETQSPSPPL